MILRSITLYWGEDELYSSVYYMILPPPSSRYVTRHVFALWFRPYCVSVSLQHPLLITMYHHVYQITGEQSVAATSKPAAY